MPAIPLLRSPSYGQIDDKIETFNSSLATLVPPEYLTLVSAVVQIGLLIVGIFLSIWWFRHIILPFLYSIYWTVRRWVRWYTPLRYLLSVVISVVAILYLPKVTPYPLQDRLFGIGLFMGIVISIVRLFDSSARLAMQHDFAYYMKRHLTPVGIAALRRTTLEHYTEEMTLDEDRAISRQVWNHCWKSIILYGIAVLIIIWSGMFVHWLGPLLFAGFAMITLFDIFNLLIVGGTSTFPTMLKSRKALKTDSYLGGMTAVGFAELIVIVTCNFYLYFHFFK